MRHYLKFLTRSILVWVLAIVVTALVNVHYMDWVIAGGLIITLGSFLVFSVLWVFVFSRNGARPNDNAPIPADRMIRVNGRMTGNTQVVSFIPRGSSRVEYTEYEVEYIVEGQKITSWFHMYPGPDLGDAYEKGVLVRLICDREKPKHFEVLGIGEK